MTDSSTLTTLNYRQFYLGWRFGVCLALCSVVHGTLLDRYLIAQDRGDINPIPILQDKFADLLSQAQRKIPRSQKYQILNQIRHRLKADRKSKDDPEQLLELAQQYKRYLFYKEALQLFNEVAENPSNDKEYLLQANRWLGEIEFVANDNVGAAIDYFKKAIDLSPRDSLKRGELLGRLGTYYFIDDQIDEMLETYAEFDRLPEKVKKNLPEQYLKANLYSGRFTSDADEAVKFFKRARSIAEADPKAFPADLVLSIFSEQNKGRRWNDPERIKRLVLLVDDKAYANEPQIREFAMEVLLAYFLEREKEWKRFENFAEKAIKLYAEFRSKDDEDTLSYSLGSQALGTFVGAADQSKKRWDKPESRRDFQKWQSQLKKMSFYFPFQVSQKDLREIMTAYRAGQKLLKAESKEKRD